MAGVVPKGAQGQVLALKRISLLVAELTEWRADYEIKQAYTEGGGVFDFVKGLRLAARLIYILKHRLSQYQLDANWGQILDKNGKYLSPECDIIIHSGKEIDRWNGEGGWANVGNIMDFRFVSITNVLAVISCKSYLTSISGKDTKYCKRLKPYLRGRKKLWLFAECVPLGKEEDIESKIRQIGHDRFWYLYGWDEKNFQFEENRPLWEKFLDEVDKIGKKEIRRATKL